MSFEMTVGLRVVDHEKYAQHRAEMTPLLEAGGGRFRYDFEVARTLKSEAAHDINRVFVVQFSNQAGKERFFADSRYVEIRARLFEKAVKGMTIIAEYATYRH
jgi:uncharacterized protein (DUF1330 family)